MTQAIKRPFDVNAIRDDFPILKQQVNGHPLVYFDNAATAQKPEVVIETMNRYYRETNSNVHRGAHALSDRATGEFEAARDQVRKFLNAPSREQIIWVRGTTEGINLVAQSYGRSTLKPGDEIIVSQLEHHSNIVPWQMVAQQTGAVLKVIPINEQIELDMDAYKSLLTDKTKIVAVNHASNAMGTINPIKEITRLAHEAGAVVVVDGAQGAPHLEVDVQDLDCDFYAFSGHKVFGPTGIGALYGRRELLESMPPYQGGGEMIERVSFSGTTYNELPFKFEAGTPAIAESIGLGATLSYLEQFDKSQLKAHEDHLLKTALELSSSVDGLRLIGKAPDKVSVFSFLIDGLHPSDMGTLLDQQGIAVRTGHHCAQPLMEHLGIPGTSRASFAFYNTVEEVEKLFAALQKIVRLFR
ncbi:cysteine sulfinate desulfinase [Hahella sp. CCB-MM4]|uniref:aminotransferase class V-fold PLP-dependent enzyme n=1 Tax=Hahella sp. (strain CCB-MM4) TaxID=1926491 RepID=UPI000B9B8BBE|nr:cysteine desulfurase [Hahella sp. CCB-MM4]OZG71172.1 cysteine sulfinate desulfinase [Hahella sp. CCB-MM4]